MSNLIFRKTPRYCRVGAGEEITPGLCNTPGFPFEINDVINFDIRGYKYLKLKRRVSASLNQSSMVTLQSWRANCDVKVLLYDTNPEFPDMREIENVAGYIVSYTCKGHLTIKQERDIISSSICRYVDYVKQH